METKPFRVRAAETEKLIAFLRSIEPEQIATYAELRAAGGFGPHDSEERVHSLARSAANVILREDAVCFLTVRGIGLKRATAPEIAQSGTDTIKRARRQCNKALKRMSTITPEQLTADDRTTYITGTAQLSALAHVASRSSQNKIQQTAMRSSQRLDLDETLKLVGRK